MSITLATIHDIALRMSGRNYSASYARDLRHIAMDCKSAMEGCEASLASVDEWLEHDRDLHREICAVLPGWDGTIAAPAAEFERAVERREAA